MKTDDIIHLKRQEVQLIIVHAVVRSAQVTSLLLYIYFNNKPSLSSFSLQCVYLWKQETCTVATLTARCALAYCTL